MDSIFNFQFGTFNNVNPSWFDWLSLIIASLVSIISIIGGFKIAQNIYNREKTDKFNESEELKLSQYKLFVNSLKELAKATIDQKQDIDTYIEKLDFVLIFHQNLNVDFLQFIDAKNLYLYFGLDNSSKIDSLNDLLKSLYLLNDFREALRSEVRAYNEKYGYHESKFFIYRSLLYNKFYKLSNERSINFIFEEGRKKWNYHADDKFMPEYIILLNKTLSDTDIIENNGLKSRELLIEKFIKPLLEISAKYIPEDSHAIEVNEIANEALTAFIEMENVTDKHIRALKSYSKNLENIHTKINVFVQ